LIEPRQLGVLVRSHKEGDDVKLTYYRAGKQQTGHVKLAKHMVSEASTKLPHNRNKIFMHTGDGPSSAYFFGEGRPESGEMRISKIEHKGAVMFFEDGKGRLEITNKEGRKFLTARNEKNDVVFSGPVETPEQRKAMPEEVRERLEKMEATDVRMPIPPLPPQPPAAGTGTHSSSTMIFGNGEMDDPVEQSLVDERAS
jgi:serine protease Do